LQTKELGRYDNSRVVERKREGKKDSSKDEEMTRYMISYVGYTVTRRVE